MDSTIQQAFATVAFMVLTHTIVSSQSCDRNEFSSDDGHCCKMCPPGSGVTAPCSATNATQCTPCVYGESFSSKPTRHSCQQCSVCSAYSITKHVCQLNRDTTCECKQDYYFDIRMRGCRRCTFCDVGFGLRRLCNSTHDTVCARCPRDHFTEFRGRDQCQQCEVCNENQFLMQDCTATQNAICIDFPPDMSPLDRPGLIGGAFTIATNNGADNSVTMTTNNGSKSSSHVNAIPIYCGVLALIILVLVIYVVWRQRRKNKLNEARKAEEGKTGSPSKDDLRRGLHQPLRSDSKATPDSGIYSDHEYQPVTGGSRVCELPPARRKLFESMLQGGSNGEAWWSHLARQLGYSGIRIANIEIRAKQEAASPLQYLLTDYGRHDDTLVQHLVEALYGIGREDAVHALYGQLRDYAPAPRYMEISPLEGHVV